MTAQSERSRLPRRDLDEAPEITDEWVAGAVLNHGKKSARRGRVVKPGRTQMPIIRAGRISEVRRASGARLALKRIETAIREHPTTGQAGRLVRFLAGVYNGSDFPFDLTDLRALDTEVANACLDYLNYDRLGKREVHHHLSGGDRELHQWMKDYGIEPALRLGEPQEQAFAELPEKAGRDRYELLDEAVDDLIDKYGRKSSAPKR